MPPNQRRIDLHVHTTYSDSTLTPLEVVRMAAERGLAAIAITDHDCVLGIAPAREAASALGIDIVSGIELTTEMRGVEIHILGLLIDWRADWLQGQLTSLQSRRRQRMEEMIARLQARDIAITLAEVLNYADDMAVVGRLHLARALTDRGITASPKEAFQRFIGSHCPAYVPTPGFSPSEALSLIRQARGISVLAHPGLSRRDDLIAPLVEMGLDGLEILHTEHSAATCRHYAHLAEKFHLLRSGGSDCHGLGKGKPLLGGVDIPYVWLEQLRAAHSQRYASAPEPRAETNNQ